MSSNLPLYGRKWKISVLKKDGKEALIVSDSDFDNATPGRGALKCTFKVHKTGFQALWWAEITIWNLMGDTETEIMKEGYRVMIEAGYAHGKYGKIFSGQIFQHMFDRQNVTDFILTLHCIVGMDILHANFVSATVASGYDYTSLIQKMSKEARTPHTVDVSPNLPTKKHPRGVTLFGEPKNLYRQFGHDCNAQVWCGDDEIFNISNVTDMDSEGEAIVLTPQTGLIGTPQQMQEGVSFRCLLNPEITVKRPLKVVKLDQTLIRQMKASIGSTPPCPLDQDGFYKIVNVAHFGDTRGNDWYTDCIGVNMSGKGVPIFTGKNPN